MRAGMIRLSIPLTLTFTAALLLTGCKMLPGQKEKDGPPAGETDKQKAARSAAETAWLEECTKLGEAGSTVAGREGWLFSAAELKSIGRGGSTASATGAIADYAASLKAKGIDLILVPIPPKALVYPDKISKNVKVKSKKPPRFDSGLKSAMETLESRNVKVVDLLPALIAARDTKTATAYPRTSSTWAPAGVQAAVKEIAEAVKKSKAGSRAGSASGIVAEPSLITFTGALATGITDAKPEALPAVTVGRISGEKQKSLSFGASGGSLLLIGGSDIYAWRENNNPAGAKGAFASLAEQLAAELQLIPDVLTGGTDAKNAARLRILRERTNGHGTLGATKTVLWVIPALDLYSSNWARVPLQLQFSESGPEIQLR